MTAQAPDQLRNHLKSFDSSKLSLRRIFIGEPSTYNDNIYPFKTKAKLAKGYINSSCWRGYIAFYDLNADGSIALQKYQNLAHEVQTVNETLEGDFWLELTCYNPDGTLYVPFRRGKIVEERNSWRGSRELLSSYQNTERLLIRDFVQQRGIKHLVHFTRIENVASILHTGLVGRNELDTRQLSYVHNDKHRLDYVPNSICLSISFPNYKMFYSYRCQEPTTDWVAIRLKPEILWEKETLFCTRNAAEKEIAQQSRPQRSGLQALRKMFENHDGFPTREITEIPVDYTTNPQAEVLILENIEPEYIVDIIVDKEDRINNPSQFARIIRENSDKAKFYRGKQYFYPRSDHKHW